MELIGEGLRLKMPEGVFACMQKRDEEEEEGVSHFRLVGAPQDHLDQESVKLRLASAAQRPVKVCSKCEACVSKLCACACVCRCVCACVYVCERARAFACVCRCAGV